MALVLWSGGILEPAAARRDKEQYKDKSKKKPAISEEKQAMLYARAEESYKKAIELDPRNDGAIFALAELYRKQGRKAEALEYYERALKLCPVSLRYRQGLSEHFFCDSTSDGVLLQDQYPKEWGELLKALPDSVKPDKKHDLRRNFSR